MPDGDRVSPQRPDARQRETPRRAQREEATMAPTAKEERRTMGTGIRAKLTTQMMLVGLGPLVVLGALGYLVLHRTTDAFDRNIQDSAQLTLTNSAKDLVGQLDTYMEE